MAASPTAASPSQVYKEGLLLKRARGLRNRRNIKWQERYCRLTSVSLDYYDPKKMTELKGQFKLEQISIVEIIAHGMFDKLRGHPFQIGDFMEVMYFAAKSPQERNEWMEAFRLAAMEKGNELLLKHHPGVYGLTNKDRWSCCGRARRECEGCADSRGALKLLGKNVDPKRDRSQTTPMDFLGIGDSPNPSPQLHNSRDDLSSSIHSDASDTTLTDQNDDTGIIRRTFTISVPDKPTNRSSRTTHSKSAPASDTSFPPKSPSLSDTIEEEVSPIRENEEEQQQKGNENENNGVQRTSATVVSMLPPQVDDVRSGASSPALSTDSGRGTSSRPRSMDTTEGENLPSTPHSTRSNITTITNDSDPTRSLPGHDIVRRNVDTISILSDVSGLSGVSGVASTMGRIKRGSRPQSILMKDSIISTHTESISDAGNDYFSLSKLHQACKDGILDLVRDELDTGANIGGQELFNGVPMLPIFIAFLHDHRHIVLSLLEHGADPNALDMSTRSCLLHLACQKGCLEMVNYLIKHKADINMRNHEDSTPLCEASKNGHSEVVKVLLNNGAVVDSNGSNFTALHYAAAAGHEEIVKLLLEKNKNNLLKKTQNGMTPYHLAFSNNHIKVMDALQRQLPSSQRPYQLQSNVQLPSGQVVSAVTFMENDRIITNSWDGIARMWSISEEEGLLHDREFKLLDTGLSTSYYAPFLALGSTSIQVIDTMSPDYEWRRTVADDSSDDESLQDPPLHFVAYCPDGRLVTAAAESNLVKVWPLITKSSVIVAEPECVVRVQEKQNEQGRIASLSLSPSVEGPWIAVVVQPGPLLTPVGNQKVHIYNWKEKKIYHILDTGKGGLTFNVCTAFSTDGQCLLIGFTNKLTKWNSLSGDCIMSYPGLEKAEEISSLACSPTNDHVAVGLTNGDIQVFNFESGAHVFTLRHKDDSSMVTSLSYSPDGAYLLSGHRKGSIELWKIFTDLK